LPKSFGRTESGAWRTIRSTTARCPPTLSVSAGPLGGAEYSPQMHRCIAAVTRAA